MTNLAVESALSAPVGPPNYALQRTSGVAGERRFGAGHKNKVRSIGGFLPGCR